MEKRLLQDDLQAQSADDEPASHYTEFSEAEAGGAEHRRASAGPYIRKRAGEALDAVRKRRFLWTAAIVVVVILLGVIIGTSNRGRGNSTDSNSNANGSNSNSTSPTSPPAPSRPKCFSELDDFAILPSDPDFAKLVLVNNPQYNNRTPTFIALPRSAQEVQLALQCATEKGVQVALKNGGHSLSGFSSINSPGFVINFARMKSIKIDTNAAVPTLTFQAGSRNGDAYEALHTITNGEWLIVGGLCPSVGSTGFLLGGGVSPTARAYGLAIDNVISMKMVLANGSAVVEASEKSNPDLFWALRGAGNSNFGVVTEATVKIHPAPTKTYTWGTMCFYTNNRSQIEIALDKFADIFHQLPLSSGVDVRLRGSDGLCFWMIMRDSFDAAYEEFKDLIGLGVDSFRLTAYPTYYDMIMNFAAARDYREVNTRPFESRNCLLPKLTAEVSRIFTDTYFDSSNPGCDFFLIGFDGAQNRVDPTATAFFWRKSQFMAMAACAFDLGDEVHHARVLAYLDKFHAAMYPHCEGSYINFFDIHLKNWENEYFGGNLERLLEVKQKWNPTGTSPIRFARELGADL